jgi:hypothetical protein
VAVKRTVKVPDHLRDKISLRVSPNDWLEKARQLKKSSNLLFIEFENERTRFDERFERDPSISDGFPDDSIVVLLLAFAVENLLKGLFVAATSPAGNVKSLKELNIPGRSHELETIAEAIETISLTAFSDEERELLQALEHHIHWAGRYPSATHIDNILSTRQDGTFKKFMLQYPNDHFGIVALYDRLERQLAALIVSSIEQAKPSRDR